MGAAGDPRDLECAICGHEIEPPLVDPMLLVESAPTPESLHRYGFVVHEACLLEVAAPAMREHVTARLAAARQADGIR